MVTSPGPAYLRFLAAYDQRTAELVLATRQPAL
jgi:hypothetical protein